MGAGELGGGGWEQARNILGTCLEHACNGWVVVVVLRQCGGRKVACPVGAGPLGARLSGC